MSYRFLHLFDVIGFVQKDLRKPYCLDVASRLREACAELTKMPILRFAMRLFRFMPVTKVNQAATGVT